MVESRRSVWRRSAALTTLVAGGFCIFAIAILVLAVKQQHDSAPLNSPAIQQLKEKLSLRPNDDALKDQLRQLDLDLREGYFAAQTTIRNAAWLLLAGGLTLALALKAHATLSASPPDAAIPTPPSPSAPTLARWSLTASAVAIGAGLASFSLLRQVQLPPPAPASQHIAQTPPTWDQLFANWPSFRGAAGDGIVRQETPLPASWDGPSGRNILWRTPLPLPGQSSPIVWNDRLFLTGASDKKRVIYCFDARSGESIWTLPLPQDATREVNVFADTGFAAPTMACDGHRLYAIFASGDLFAISLAGEILWQRSLGIPDSQYGYASSLAIHQDKVIVQFDQGEPDSGKSSLIAFDGSTGRPAWRTQRRVGSAWSSPIVAPTRTGDRIFVCSNPLVAAYDPATGKELWALPLMEGDVAPSPVFHDGVVYVAGDRAKSAAIPDTATQPKPAWTGEDNLPEIVSPLCDGENLLLVTGHGSLLCLNAQTGAKRWEHDLEAPVQASPLLIGDVVYLTDYSGRTHLFRLAESAYKELAASPLGQKISASPAVAAGRLYFRTESHLICVGNTAFPKP